MIYQLKSMIFQFYPRTFSREVASLQKEEEEMEKAEEEEMEEAEEQGELK